MVSFDLNPGRPGFVGSVNPFSSPRRERYDEALVDPLVHSWIRAVSSGGIARNCDENRLLPAFRIG